MPTSAQATIDAVEEAKAVAGLARASAAEAEKGRRLPAHLVADLARRGLLRMALPAAYGGPEVAPLDQLDAIEELSAADGAAGWCVAISSTTSSLSWFLPAESAARVFSDPLAAYGGAFAPTGTARQVDDGWACDGRWAWGSGAQHCAWVTGGCLTDTGEFRLMFFDAEQVRILDNWDPVGLRGTGSNDFEVTNAVVPSDRSLRPGVDRHIADCALASFPNFCLLAASVAAVTLGLARRAVDELVALAVVKTPTLANSRLSEYAPAQLRVAGAEASARAGRAFLRDEVEKTWDLIGRGHRVPVEQRALIRLACAHAATAATAAIDLCHRAAGGSSVPTSSPLARCLRDVHTATQHLMLADRNLLTYGRLRFGVETDTATL